MTTWTRETGPWLQTATGGAFPLIDFTPEDFNVEDMCVQLPRINRFLGATHLPYSVAQHCLLVSSIVPPHLAWEGLLHDGHEYVVGDVSAPLKRVLPDYRELEAQIQSAFAKRFGLPERMSPAVMKADLIALVTERRDMMPRPPKSWGEAVEKYEPIAERIEAMGWAEAETAFRRRFADLVRARDLPRRT